jgi:hypothetical protein
MMIPTYKMFCILGRSPKIPNRRPPLLNNISDKNTNYNNKKQLILVFVAPLLDEFGGRLLTKSNAHPTLALICMTQAVKLCIFEETVFCE